MGLSAVLKFFRDRIVCADVNFEHGTNFKLKDLMEWSSGEIKPRDDEVIYKLSYGVSVAFKKPVEK